MTAQANSTDGLAGTATSLRQNLTGPSSAAGTKPHLVQSGQHHYHKTAVGHDHYKLELVVIVILAVAQW